MARRYRRRHSRVSHMRSGSERASSSAPFADVFGSVDHDFTVVRSSSYFFCCSAVRTGGAAGFLPSAGCGKGPMADIVVKEEI